MTGETARPVGLLPVHRFDGNGDIVVAVHGITANGRSFAQVAAQLAGRARLWAPDLRGRAEARALPGPWGLAVHADDVIAVLEHAVIETGRRVRLTGHSMGAFVAALAAARRPDLVEQLILLDGGLAIPLPEGTSDADVDAMIQAVIGPAMTRLSMRFDNPAAYLEFWAQHPAIGAMSTASGPVGERVREYLLHDLMPAPDGGAGYVSTCVLDAVRADGADVLTDAEAHAAPIRVSDAGVPTRLLWAPRGLQDEDQGLYDQTRLDAMGLPADLAVERLADHVNHYTVLFEESAVQRIVEALAD